MEAWNSGKSSDLYRVPDWGAGYFSINNKGNITVSPTRDGRSFELIELTKSLQKKGIEAPILFRFNQIIQDRVHQLQKAFEDAIEQWSYKGAYRVTYPIKVNQESHVVEAVRTAGTFRNLGLEVGSKPELLAVLAVHDLPDAPLLCNGYKDSEYIELALLGRKLGRRSIIIVEQFYELQEVLNIAARLGVEAEIGFRIKPSTKGSGMWISSSGDQAKFGLNTQELLTAIEVLKEAKKLDWVKLMHFHIGSQIPSIAAFKKVLKEATRMYAEIATFCPNICFFDVGGGLAVDYDGSKTNFDSSMNYSLLEYAETVISAVSETCDRAGIPHPDIISESGRALVAHHAVLVMEVIDVAPGIYGPPPTKEQCPTDHPILEKLLELYQTLSIKNCIETFHETVDLKDDVLQEFISGKLSLPERAFAERLQKHLFHRISLISKELKRIPEDLEKIDSTLRDTCFCNFSIFQSMPDSWAIDQLFPIMPIHRLEEEPTRKAILADLTCDSDGEINRFIDLKDVSDYLLCHETKPDASYFLGAFIIGAYQEILGDLHNLFGDTNAVHVFVNENGEAEVTHVVKGDTNRDVLDYVEYEPEDLVHRFQASIENSVAKKELSAEESASILKRYIDAMNGYTYLVKYQE